MPSINDQDAWPAYTYLICSETSEPQCTWCWVALMQTTVVVILTILKRYVDPAISRYQTTLKLYVHANENVLTTAESSFSRVVLPTMYRDGELSLSYGVWLQI